MHDIGVADVLEIIIQFGDGFEGFDSSLSHSLIKIEDNINGNGKTLYKSEISWSDCNAFGLATARPGAIYHWKLKVCNAMDSYLNIGIMEANLISDYMDKAWISHRNGYSYYAVDGKIYNDNKWWGYGKKYAKHGTIIDIWLDLKDKYQLSFAANDEKFGAASSVQPNTNFKLAIGIDGYPKKIKLLLFEIC